ncbi:hypothetical protein FGO68_gene11122 [Halteria grandinella]|uniref:Uncharacterized protein n=1 Tax=Halteria grandinella TaxID=5974 RepID=A0A8J8NL97_HALGN|nr:hypothetical protein FGO68_gene11122 [Halteria grandinella]
MSAELQVLHLPIQASENVDNCCALHQSETYLGFESGPQHGIPSPPNCLQIVALDQIQLSINTAINSTRQQQENPILQLTHKSQHTLEHYLVQGILMGQRLNRINGRKAPQMKEQASCPKYLRGKGNFPNLKVRRSLKKQNSQTK